MLHFTLRVENPWAKSRSEQMDFFCKDWSVSKNKNCEVQLTWFDWQTIFELHVQTHWRGHDHAGPRFEITILGLFFNIQLYDGRHWNHEKNRWYLPGDEEEEYGT
jgi:hypothetical protein